MGSETDKSTERVKTRDRSVLTVYHLDRQIYTKPELREIAASGDRFAIQSVLDTQLDDMAKELTHLYEVYNGPEEIRYQSGPKFSSDRHLSWKECTHIYAGKHRLGKQAFAGLYWSASSAGLWGNKPQITRGWSEWEIPYQLIGNYHQSSLAEKLLCKAAGTQDVLSRKLSQQIADTVAAEFWAKTRDPMMIWSALFQLLLPFSGMEKRLVGLSFNGVKNTLKGALSGLTKLYKKPGMTCGDMMKAAFSADLINRFVIQTTLDDLRHFLTSFDNVVEQVQHIQGLKNQEMHWIAYDCCDLDKEAADLDVDFQKSPVVKDYWSPGLGFRGETQDNNFRGSGSVHYRTRTSEHLRLTERLDVFATVRLNGFDPVLHAIQAWKRDMGLNRPLESLWDLVPFSFVLDYFVHVDQLVSKISDSLTQESTRQANAGIGIEINHVYKQQWLECGTFEDLSEVERPQGNSSDNGYKPYQVHESRGFLTGPTYTTGAYTRREINGESLADLKDQIELAVLNGCGPDEKRGFTPITELSDTRKRTLIELGYSLGYSAGSTSERGKEAKHNNLLRWLRKHADDLDPTSLRKLGRKKGR